MKSEAETGLRQPQAKERWGHQELEEGAHQPDTRELSPVTPARSSA